MRTSVIRIGNSFGIRISMPVIKECHIEGEIEMSVKNRGIHIHAVRKPRENWDKSFRKMAKAEYPKDAVGVAPQVCSLRTGTRAQVPRTRSAVKSALRCARTKPRCTLFLAENAVEELLNY